MSTQVVEKKDVGDVEDVLGDIIAEVETGESAISPADEAEKVAENGPDFSPLENPKVAARCLNFHRAVLKIKDTGFYRNPGANSYINYTVGARKSITGLHFSKQSARITLHRTDKEGKKSIGDISVKINEDGLTLDDESITQKAVIALVKKYHSDRGWI